MVEVFREVRRVLRDDGTVWLNLGDSYAQGRGHGHWTSKGDKGDEHGQRVEGFWASKGAEDVGLKPKDLVGIPWRVALALQADGWWLRNAIVWKKLNYLPSPVQDRLTCSYEMIFLLAKSAKYYFDLHPIRVPHQSGTYDAEGAFTPSQNWFEEGEGHRKMDQTEGHLGAMAGPTRRVGRGLFNPNGKNPGDHWPTGDDAIGDITPEHRIAFLEERVRHLEAHLQEFTSPGDVLELPTQPFPGSHFAVWPQAIPERCILVGTSEHGCCDRCGAPWRRVEGRGDKQGNAPPSGGAKAAASQEVREAGGIGRLDGGRRAADGSTFHNNPNKRVHPTRLFDGWEPTCTCEEAGIARSVVLDPFSGSGTTGMVALRLGRDYVGLDLNESYLPMACARLRDDPVPDTVTAPPQGSVMDIFGEEDE
jgi:hypothetical protein